MGVVHPAQVGEDHLHNNHNCLMLHLPLVVVGNLAAVAGNRVAVAGNRAVVAGNQAVVAGSQVGVVDLLLIIAQSSSIVDSYSGGGHEYYCYNFISFLCAFVFAIQSSLRINLGISSKCCLQSHTNTHMQTHTHMYAFMYITCIWHAHTHVCPQTHMNIYIRTHHEVNTDTFLQTYHSNISSSNN